MLTNVRSDRVKSVRSLSRRSVRERTGRFVVDGPQGVREAIRYAAARVDDLYVTSAAIERHDAIVQAALEALLSDDVVFTKDAFESFVAAASKKKQEDAK